MSVEYDTDTDTETESVESMMYIRLIAALDWSPILWWIDVILKVAVGLGAVIFVHELGHFLVAKACGVKFEKFMIGFDIGGYKISRQWGETEYGIGILPLGGYVKMLGQDDDPAHIAEQMQKSQVDAAQHRRGANHRAQRRERITSTAAATWPRACRSGWRSSRPA